MQDRPSTPGGEDDHEPNIVESETRPQRGGEAETTRFGMEDGDNTDVPSAPASTDEDEADDRFH